MRSTHTTFAIDRSIAIDVLGTPAVEPHPSKVVVGTICFWPLARCLRSAYFQGSNAPGIEEHRGFKTLFLHNLHPCVRAHLTLMCKQGRPAMQEVRKMAQMTLEMSQSPEPSSEGAELLEGCNVPLHTVSSRTATPECLPHHQKGGWTGGVTIVATLRFRIGTENKAPFQRKGTLILSRNPHIGKGVRIQNPSRGVSLRWSRLSKLNQIELFEQSTLQRGVDAPILLGGVEVRPRHTANGGGVGQSSSPKGGLINNTKGLPQKDATK